MNEEQHGDVRSDVPAGTTRLVPGSGANPEAASNGDEVLEVSPTDGAEPASELTPEEQMELYENDLKENDWGHQPC